MGKFLEFKDVFGDTLVLNKKSGYPLGKIEYYTNWKQFVFSAVSDAVFNDQCLMDIVLKIKELNQRGR